MILGAIRRDRGDVPLDVLEQKWNLCCVVGTAVGQHVGGDRRLCGGRPHLARAGSADRATPRRETRLAKRAPHP